MASVNVKEDVRKAREMLSREQSVRAAEWSPASVLPEIPESDEWAYRWLRVSIKGQLDAMNVSMGFREGWEPCKAEEFPDVKVLADPTSRYKDGIEIGGLLLCKTPKEKQLAKEAYDARASDAQLRAVDNQLMKENDPRMPMFAERRSKITFGRG